MKLIFASSGRHVATGEFK